MVILTIGIKKNSQFSKKITETVIGIIGKEGFYATINKMFDSKNRLKLNGKKSKKIIFSRDECDALKKIEKIRDYVMVIYDCRYNEKIDDSIFLFSESLSVLKPGRCAIIFLKDSSKEKFNLEIISKKIIVIESERNDFFAALSEITKIVAQENYQRKYKNNEIDATPIL